MSIRKFVEILENEAVRLDTIWIPDCDGAPIVECYTYSGRSKKGFAIEGHYFMSGSGESLSIPNLSLEE